MRLEDESRPANGNPPGQFVGNPQHDDVDSRSLSDFLHRWRLLDPDRERPAFHDLPLTHFANHVPFLVLHLVEPNTGRLLVRFQGAGYVAVAGDDMMGRYVDEIDGAEGLQQRCEWLIENKCPYLLTDSPVVWYPKAFRNYSTVACPLYEGDETVRGIVFRVEFES